ncbi:hypothetical protein G6O67_007019 [Ophiocordyceps sinensis]|uniref:Ricin B lectin domain-containing protein n=2 Tax=Ophiocordyceps sinensis TaxID=72228 RepID=A0A8H4LTR9_9HYPO|nr:transposase [Ophiocordyceps sinensis CO18]KAF4505021.1 hypothetical protein G6O67_007019 [Ophiocordyceps sinensis]
MDDTVDGDDSTICGFTALTPPTTIAATVWDGWHHAVPWPGHTFMIVEKNSKRAITLPDTSGRVCLQDTHEGHDTNARQQWHCVRRYGWFGFLNPQSGKYLGHNDHNGIVARADKQGCWENLMPRKHPDGGYELLLPHWWWAVRVMVVAHDGKSLAVRDDGTTLWEFVKV